ncbi:hypothetical protein MUK42_20119 [Musa troglodytarum]|uniref:Uncharacterized protein n=1 Tax=Musa troglodytarum TaxID=320322 RepID=A0A9E7E914_9LILI|nr:hypothetical protein MUK42_20119 [Musa troglodytarum]
MYLQSLLCIWISRGQSIIPSTHGILQLYQLAVKHGGTRISRLINIQCAANKVTCTRTTFPCLQYHDPIPGIAIIHRGGHFEDSF